ncbi:MAG: NAD(P)H-hydrate dehydratase [Candidatus Woesearchaeota archaeon]|jgi:NAD(P)H-hydrate epimerase|nr:NAD(P)H-hydrate dehydratase [Candidatus Woesearchaeota archaeon]MDP7458101.1 NAD(P)H-hydrate dehydratase [Candidatus Woesearchaeota archaeon]
MSQKNKKRAEKSHKGQNGKVLIVGGSKDYVGAVVLAGLACLRVGADYVMVCAPEKVAWTINTLTPDLITKKFKGDYFSLSQARKIKDLAKEYDVLLIGNGLGDKSASFVKALTSLKITKVIDADAIKAVKLQDLDNALITPHEAEFATLLKNSKLAKKTLQKNIGTNVVLLKGHTDTIISQKRAKENHTGNPGMTKAGTGDVLAGLSAGFLSQGYTLFEAASRAAYYNGKIGDLLLKKHRGFTYLASDMVNEIRRFA